MQNIYLKLLIAEGLQILLMGKPDIKNTLWGHPKRMPVSRGEEEVSQMKADVDRKGGRLVKLGCPHIELFIDALFFLLTLLQLK